MATSRECSSCNLVHGEPRDRQCLTRATGSLFDNTQTADMEEQGNSQPTPAQAQASSFSQLSQQTLISEDTVLETIRQVDSEVLPDQLVASTGANNIASTETLMLKALKDLTGKFTHFEARAMASDRLVSQLTEKIELQQQTINSLTDNVKKGRGRGSSVKKTVENVHQQNKNVGACVNSVNVNSAKNIVMLITGFSVKELATSVVPPHRMHLTPRF